MCLLLVHGWRLTLCLVLVVVTLPSSQQQSSVTAFLFAPTLPLKTTRFKMQEKCWFLYMGKGFGSGRNKQEDLARKMELIKKQRAGNGDAANVKEGDKSSSSPSSLPKDQEEIKRQQEERDLFSKLLAKNPPTREQRSFTKTETSRSAAAPQQQTLFGTSNVTPKVKAKDLKRKIKASAAEQNAKKNKNMMEESEKQVLQEGDTAKRLHFETLISLKTAQPLGSIGAAQLVPWVPPYLQDCLVVLADPRPQSSDLRRTIQYLVGSTNLLTREILAQVVVISVDPIVETAKWMKRVGMDDDTIPIQIFSDTQLEWMRRYSAVANDDQWSMSILVFCTNGIIQKVLRKVDPLQASQLVMDLVQSMQEEDEE